MRKSASTTFVLFFILSISLLPLFQNCGQVGGESPLSSLSGFSNCKQSPWIAGCESSQSSGRLEDLSITISGNTGSPTKFARTGAKLHLEGTCNAADFPSADIQWEYRREGTPLTPATVYSTLRTQTRCLRDGSYKVDAEITSDIATQLTTGNRIVVTVRIVGRTAQGSPVLNSNAVDSKTFEAADIIPGPKLDSAPLSGSNAWEAQRVISAATGNQLSIDDIAGFCKYSPNLNNDIYIRAKQVGTPDAGTFEVEQLQGPIPCQPLSSDARFQNYAARPAYYNGFFVVPAIIRPHMDAKGFSNAKHLEIWAEQTDPTEGSIQKSSATVTIFMFKDPQYGKGWTVPFARKALENIRRAAKLKFNVSATTAEASIFVLKAGAGIRREIVNEMGVTEQPVPVTVKVNNNDRSVQFIKVFGEYNPNSGNGDGIEAALYKIISGQRKCDERLTDGENLVLSGLNDPSQLPDGFYDVKEAMSFRQAMTKIIAAGGDQQLAQLGKMALCLNYWMWIGLHGPTTQTNPNWMDDALVRGLRYGVRISSSLNDTQQQFNWDNVRGYAIGGDQGALPGGGISFTLVNFYRSLVVSAAKFGAGADLTTFGDTRASKIYNAAVQFYLNALMERMTDFEGIQEGDSVVNTFWSQVFTDTAITQSSRALCVRERTGITPQKNDSEYDQRDFTNPAADYSVYPQEPFLGSIDANGSIHIPNAVGE